MTLTRDAWPAFFAAVHDGHAPFRWQTRLLDHLVDRGRWPDQLAAPTGSGKTAVIDLHVFAVALTSSAGGPRLPRRLAMVVDRRALVDDQYVHAREVAALLRSGISGDGVVAEVAVALSALRWAGSPTNDGSPLGTARLRGGLPVPRSWRDDPTACTVICATPDMWGSRVLMRGYGTSEQARPREAGLLAVDAALVVDEAHLSRQLVATARRVADLQEICEPTLGVPRLQVVATTATPDRDAGHSVGVGEQDLRTDHVLARRLAAPKPARLLPVPNWPLSGRRGERVALIGALADQAVSLVEEFGPTVGCFMNTVAAAVELREELQRRRADDGERPLSVELVCGRQRPFDVEALSRRRPGLLTIDGNPDVDVLVATQSLEVGVDLDLSAALTDPAPGTALAQRAGRVNRLGRRARTAIVVGDPDRVPDLVAPYRTTDVEAGLAWVRRRSSAESGMAPWALVQDQPPTQTSRRTLLQRVELADIWQWARTSDDLAAEPELDLWLSDDLDADHDVGLVVRQALPTDPADLALLLRDLPPRPYETFPVRLPVARDALTRIMTSQSALTVALLRDGDVLMLTSPDDLPSLRPADLVVVDDEAVMFRAGVVDKDGDECSQDVLGATDALADMVLRLERDFGREDPFHPLVTAALDAAVPAAADRPARADRHALADALDDLVAAGHRQAPALAWARDELRGARPMRDLAVTVHNIDGPSRLLVMDARPFVHDEEVRQTWSRSAGPVPLTKHSDAVARRAESIGRRLGLSVDDTEALRLAGLHHDDGKADPRFQVVLGRTDDDEPLAKSGDSRAVHARARWALSGLPGGWRHEQESVVRAWPEIDALPVATRDLVARLIGTSHGHGRHCFRHGSADLGTDDAGLSARLYDHGEWDELIERTTRRLGVWGCAYLEAILRAADGQVSAEGS